MNRWGPVTVAILGLAILFSAAVGWSIPTIENDLTTRAELRLASAGVDEASVSFDGRDGFVSGVEAEAAQDELRSLRGARQIEAEPTKATTTITTAPPPPAIVEVSRSNGSVRLDGTVASSADRDQLVASITGAGYDVEDGLMIDETIDQTNVAGLAPLIAPVLVGSDDGVVSFRDGTVVISGTAFDPVEAERIQAAAEEADEAGLAVENRFTTRVLSEAQQITALQDEIDQIFELARAIEGQNPSFEISDGELSETATETLDRVIVAMRRYPLPWADIVGHTDAVGTTETNQVLSELRAASVAEYLTNGGIETMRLAASGAGESEPVADNSTAEGRAENRRVDFAVKQSGS